MIKIKRRAKIYASIEYLTSVGVLALAMTFFVDGEIALGWVFALLSIVAFVVGCVILASGMEYVKPELRDYQQKAIDQLKDKDVLTLEMVSGKTNLEKNDVD